MIHSFLLFVAKAKTRPSFHKLSLSLTSTVSLININEINTLRFDSQQLKIACRHQQLNPSEVLGSTYARIKVQSPRQRCGSSSCKLRQRLHLAFYMLDSSKQLRQKICPHYKRTGAINSSKQMGHSHLSWLVKPQNAVILPLFFLETGGFLDLLRILNASLDIFENFPAGQILFFFLPLSVLALSCLILVGLVIVELKVTFENDIIYIICGKAKTYTFIQMCITATLFKYYQCYELDYYGVNIHLKYLQNILGRFKDDLQLIFLLYAPSESQMLLLVLI